MGVPMTVAGSTIAGTAVHGAAYSKSLRPGSAGGEGVSRQPQSAPPAASGRTGGIGNIGGGRSTSPGLTVQMPAAPRKYMEGAAVEVLCDTPRGSQWTTGQVVAVRRNPAMAERNMRRPPYSCESHQLVYDLKPLEVSPAREQGGKPSPALAPRNLGTYQGVPPQRLREPTGTSSTPLNLVERGGRVLRTSSQERARPGSGGRPTSRQSQGPGRSSGMSFVSSPSDTSRAPLPASELRPAPLSDLMQSTTNADDNQTVRSVNLSGKFEAEAAHGATAAPGALTYSASPSLESQGGAGAGRRSFA